MNKITQITHNILLGRSNVNVEEIFSSLNGVKSFNTEEYDEVDSVIIGNKLKHKKTKYVDPNIEVYKMNHKRRGIALIFNNVKIYPARNNAEECSRNLSQTLQMMGFDVQLIVNVTLQVLIEKLKDVASQDHTNNDCLAIAVLSTGTSGYLKADNMFYPAQMLWMPFLSDSCPSLIDKPKIFFLQTYYDSSYNGIHGFDQSINFSFPDIMVIHLFYNSSWQNTNSCLMNKITQELNEHWRTHDLFRMMTSIVRHVVNYNRTLSNEKKLQAPTIVSTLTRLVYFDKTKYLVELSKNEKTDFDPLLIQD
ncbi:caspase-1-like [Apis laboriosa]|uniref:caspase-1-like n=1 Tax=Apis laboriosa TaxID=183418 RepID=UPI001CC48BA2|nr:caspase-1-like [Apis laboriosa]